MTQRKINERYRRWLCMKMAMWGKTACSESRDAEYWDQWLDDVMPYMIRLVQKNTPPGSSLPGQIKIDFSNEIKNP